MVGSTFQRVLKERLMNCDDCKHYEWYYDRCRKWDCEVDRREVHNCFEPMKTPILDAMIKGANIA